MQKGPLDINPMVRLSTKLNQKGGLENYVLIKAICLTIAGREAKAIKPDVTDSYQLTLSSKLDVQKVVDLSSGEIIHCLVINLNNIMYELEGSGKVFAIRALLTFLKEIPGFYC